MSDDIKNTNIDSQNEIENFLERFEKLSSDFDRSSSKKGGVYGDSNDYNGHSDAYDTHSDDSDGDSRQDAAPVSASRVARFSRSKQQPSGRTVHLNADDDAYVSGSSLAADMSAAAVADAPQTRPPFSGSSYAAASQTRSYASASSSSQGRTSSRSSGRSASGSASSSASGRSSGRSASGSGSGGASSGRASGGSGSSRTSGGSSSGRSPSGGSGSRKRKKNRFHLHPLKFILFALLLVFVAGGISVFAAILPIIVDSPEINPDDISSILTQSSTLYDDEGNVIDDIYIGDGMRTNVLYNEMPQDLVDAFVAIEDRTFWTHHGFNIVRIFGAIRDSILHGGGIKGTSTLTQQLARNIWLPDEKSDRNLGRKIQEAFIAMQLENKLTKYQIIEAYMNTIPLGNRSYGVQAAAQAYFSKDVGELTLAECAAIASLPQAPTRYALIQTFEREKISADDPNLVAVNGQYAYVYNDAYVSRKNLVLSIMLELEFITQQEHDEAVAVDLREHINPRLDNESMSSNYFADYTIEKVTKDLISELGIDEERAHQMLYTGGLKIHTTMNRKMQSIIETELSNNDNFPRLVVKKDKAGNIIAPNGVLLNSYDSYFDADGNFTLSPDEYEGLDNGDLMLFKDKRLNFYNTQVHGETDYSVEFKDMYIQDERTYYIMRGGVIPIPREYKTKNENGDLIINHDFFINNPDIFRFVDGGIVVAPSSYSLRQQVVQPQSAMVLVDYATGGIKAMVGGRNTEGRLLYNRADSPRQPGSSIKPMSVYGPALQMGADKEPIVNGENTYGNYWTAASGILDGPLEFQGKIWPKNWYDGYRGMQTMRRSIEQSVNVNAVKVQLNIGSDRSLKFLKGLGVSSVVETGATNDMNPAALALGGMSRGISPLEMAAAYGAFGNQGLYVEPRPYSKITNRRGEAIIDHESYSNQAMDPAVAWLITDMLRTTVTNGIANRAAIAAQPVAGKTGTTSDKYDAWFVGFTPQYSASLWIGCDVGIELAEGSGAATRVWSKVMQQICEGTERGSFHSAPSNITSKVIDSTSGLLPSSYSSTRSEYFISGTEPTTTDTASRPVYICPLSGHLATPYCPTRILFNPDGGDKPTYYCNLHNSDPEAFPIDPEKELVVDFYWDGTFRDDYYYEDIQSQNETDDDNTDGSGAGGTSPGSGSGSSGTSGSSGGGVNFWPNNPSDSTSGGGNQNNPAGSQGQGSPPPSQGSGGGNQGQGGSGGGSGSSGGSNNGGSGSDPDNLPYQMF